MFKKFFRHFLLFLFVLIQVASAQIREIPNPNLPDIAVAWYDQMGPIIVFNPIVVQQVGPYVSTFFRAHEYGHHNLGHIQQSMVSGPVNYQWTRISFERDADLWATQVLFNQGNYAAIEAAIMHFRSGKVAPSPLHPHPIQRASYISQLYQQLRMSKNQNPYDSYPGYSTPPPVMPNSDFRIPSSPSPVDDPYYY